MTPPPTRRTERRRRAGAVALGLAAIGLAACGGGREAEMRGPSAAWTQAQARAHVGVIDPYRQMLVIGPSARFDSGRLPQSWYVATHGGGIPKFVTATKDGVLGLRLDGDGNGAILGRRLQVPLLNMPYLRWGWYLQPPGPATTRTRAATGEPPVLLRVVVGFRDRASDDDGSDAHGPPKIDRALSLEWRADGTAPAASGSVVMRAGMRDSGRWIIEAVDLLRLYGQAWPHDRWADAQIVFVAVGAGPTPVPVTGYVAEVVLSP